MNPFLVKALISGGAFISTWWLGFLMYPPRESWYAAPFMVTFALAISGTAGAAALFAWQIPEWNRECQVRITDSNFPHQLTAVLQAFKDNAHRLDPEEPSSEELEALALSEILKDAKGLYPSPKGKEDSSGEDS